MIGAPMMKMMELAREKGVCTLAKKVNKDTPYLRRTTGIRKGA